MKGYVMFMVRIKKKTNTIPVFFFTYFNTQRIALISLKFCVPLVIAASSNRLPWWLRR